MNDRLCENCRKPLVQHEGETASRFRKRSVCSKGCAAALGNRRRYGDTSTGPRECERCHATLTRRDGEKPAYFRRRAYCSQACANAVIAGKVAARWAARGHSKEHRENRVAERVANAKGAAALIRHSAKRSIIGGIMDIAQQRVRPIPYDELRERLLARRA